MTSKQIAPSTFDSTLLRYALAGSAVLAAPFASHAAPIYSGSINSVISAASPGPSFDNLPVTLDATVTDFTLSVEVDSSDLASVVVSAPGTTYFVANGDGPEALTLGTLISSANATAPAGDLARSSGTSLFSAKTGNWTSSEPAFLGVQFDISGAAHYGWAQLIVEISNGSLAQVTLVDYAYESQAGAGILAGDKPAVPEPSTLALFALGAAGVMALRRKQPQSR